ncbi:AbrB family transcriptional regulator, partial [Thioclava sp. BHET1]
LMVVISTMVVVAMIFAGPAASPSTAGAVSDWASTLRVLALALVGIAAARYLRFLPAPASLVPMVLGATLAISGINMAMPGWLIALGYLVIGAQIGLRMTPELFAAGLRALPALIGASLLLIGLCAGSGAILALVTGHDLTSAMLATVPG